MHPEVERYYDARTDEDLRLELESEGYLVRWNDDDVLELFEFGGGYGYMTPYWEKSTGELFDCVQAAHRYVFS
jgi:hypothetical protein